MRLAKTAKKYSDSSVAMDEYKERFPEEDKKEIVDCCLKEISKEIDKRACTSHYDVDVSMAILKKVPYYVPEQYIQSLQQALCKIMRKKGYTVKYKELHWDRLFVEELTMNISWERS